MASHRYEFQIAISSPPPATPPCLFTLHVSHLAVSSMYDDDDDAAHDRDDEHVDVAAADDDNALVKIGLIVTIMLTMMTSSIFPAKGPSGSCLV